MERRPTTPRSRGNPTGHGPPSDSDPAEKTTREGAPIVARRSRVMVMIGGQRYALDVSAMATPLRAQPGAPPDPWKKPDRRV